MGPPRLLIFLTVLLLASAPIVSGRLCAEPLSATLAEDLRPRIQPTENRILILSPGALYRFHPESEAWTTTTQVDGLPSGSLQGFCVTGDNIWVACGDGTGVSDVRFDDWQCYRPGECYPGKIVFDIEADDDYAYAGTDGGLARFDQYILEWELLEGPAGEPLGSIHDVAVGDERVWFALDRGVAEFRKETESFRIDTRLGELDTPRVVALRQTTQFLWAVTDVGLARYDKDLQSWTSFKSGVDLPDARIRQLIQEGDDIWLGTDEGLWRYRSDAGIWRRDESGDEMPGEQVLTFVPETDRIWVVTEKAFAVYEKDAARWVDYSSSVPLDPVDVIEMSFSRGTLMFVASDRVVYGLSQGQSNPSLFTFRTNVFASAETARKVDDRPFRITLDDAGLGARSAGGASLNLKGGATIYLEDDDTGDQSNSTGLGEMVSDTRLDLSLAGRFAGDRTLSGFYDSTDPDNSAYQLTYRGARSDILRMVNLGEIEEQLFNSRLAPGTGLRGGQARAELGPRSEATHRRLVTADAWVGERRTLPGRDVFFGGNRTVESSLRDIDYARAQVFPLPDGWTASDLTNAVIYSDDADETTDDPNTVHRELAGLSGSWDRLRPSYDYALGPAGQTLILSAPLESEQRLVAVGAGEVDLTDQWLRTHYWISVAPVPGSLELSIADSTGSAVDSDGTTYIHRFGLDDNNDGLIDPERFSPITGYLSMPESPGFPQEVYADDPTSFYKLNYRYNSNLSTFRLSNTDLVPESERVTVDREILRPNIDYTIIPQSGLFVFYEHVLLDDDTIIEVEYIYEFDEDSSGNSDALILAGQAGLAPNDHIFLGMNTTRWENDAGLDVTTADLNSRLEWKDEDRFLRVTPEVAFSATESTGGENDKSDADSDGTAAGIGLQGRYRNLELSATHRNLGSSFSSFEDRRTLLGRLREESEASGRLYIGENLQAEVEWSKLLSDSVSSGGPISSTIDSAGSEAGSGSGEESSLMTGLRLLRSGLPNLVLRRGRVLLDAPGYRQEKTITRAELELSPDQAGIRLLGMRRFWLRAFIQRSEREFSGFDTGEAAGTDSSIASEAPEKRTTDHAFIRLNGSVGSPLTWNLAFEDRRTHLPDNEQSSDYRRYQELDATVQTRPHSSLDAYFHWESTRDLFWHPEGTDGGFGVKRLALTTAHFYPGRIMSKLSPLSFRFDLGGNETEDGEPGIDLPGFGSLWSKPSEVSVSQRTRTGTLESRVQLLAWMRWVERWERESERGNREGLGSKRTRNQLESRLEMRPRAGLLTLRVIGTESVERRIETEKRHRFWGQWDQLWGRGLLTYISLEAERISTRDRKVGDLTHTWNPQARVTYRRTRWHLDTSLGGSLTWTRTKDSSVGAVSGWDELRRQSVTVSLSVRPIKIATFKLQYDFCRSETGPDLAGSSTKRGWKSDHDLRLRLLIRA